MVFEFPILSSRRPFERAPDLRALFVRDTDADVAAFLGVASPSSLFKEPCMNVEFINPPTLSTGGFSQVVSISGGGRTLYISGQVAYDPKGNVVGNTLEEQSELCFENLRLALAAAGAEFKHIVKITVFLRDMSTERVKAFRAIRAKHFGDHKPAATIVGAPALVDDALQVEIEAVAVLP